MSSRVRTWAVETRHEPQPTGSGGLLTLAEQEKRHIRLALEKTNGIVYGERGAARLLDIHPDTLRSRMTKLGLRK